MRNAPQHEPRRYLIAIGSPYCPKMGASDLTQVSYDIDQIDRLLTSKEQGYTRVLRDEIGLGETSTDIVKALSNWFASPDRRSSDCVVIYYAGHGDEGGRFGEHYLFTIESDPQKVTSTAIKTSSLVECFFPRATNQECPQNILLILDTCYSGSGGQQLSGVLNTLRGTAPRESGFWIMSSTDADTRAGDGDFIEALTSVMSLDHPLFQDTTDFLPIDAWLGAINQYFETKYKSQRAVFNSSYVQTQAQFIRNPRFAGLLSRFPDADRLLPLLERISLERLSEAYRGCYPEYSNQSFPRSPKAFLSALIHLPNGVERRLPQFVDLLMQDEACPADLQKWGSGDRPSVRVVKEYCLMVYVCESKLIRDRYEVLAVLSQGSDSSSTLSVGEKEAETFSDDQLPKVVANLLRACFDEGVPLSKLAVQCFLPKRLLNVAIEQGELVINSAKQISATVCKSFVVRSLERQLELQKPKKSQGCVDGNWQERWATLTENRTADCRGLFVLHQGDDGQFYNDLQDEMVVGCGFVGIEDPDVHEERFDEIVLAGIPIALWLRPDHTAADPDAVIASVLSQSIEALLQSLTRGRKEARRNGASELAQMVQYVALLWDNPLQPFPANAYPET
jgi:hypothetical protein